LENVTIDALIFALLVDVVEATKHFDGGDMRSSVIDDTFGSLSYQILEQLQGLAWKITVSQVERAGQPYRGTPCRSDAIGVPLFP
jgi:hypothetical protein